MNTKRIKIIVEAILNGDDYASLPAENLSNHPVAAFLYHTAERLIYTYRSFKANKCGQADYLVSLRNFMLAFQMPLSLNRLEISENNPFGIYRDTASGEYYVSDNLPAFIPHPDFIRDAFIGVNTSEPLHRNSYLLWTNRYIESLTGFTRFKSLEQKLCVYGGLGTPEGYTSLISMPTGGGKSLITQTLAYADRGLTIVVVPTVSLAIDQERVAKKNIKVAREQEICCYYSGVRNMQKIFQAIEQRTARLLFISPEALIKNEHFKHLLAEANRQKYIRNLVIDEAHIVVEWGSFFRVDYQCLGPWRTELVQTTPEIRTFLLSATFQDGTVESLHKIFATEDKWLEIRCDALRREPRFIFVKAKNGRDKKQKVLSLIHSLPRPMIIYVNSPYDAKCWKKILEYYGYANVHTFTGETKTEERNKLIAQWSDNQYEMMLATSAFGVGVDKTDVRTVLHLYVPDSPDVYYQELGRGGRDGLNCLSVMCIEDKDILSARERINKVLTTAKLWGRWWSMWLHSTQWQGERVAIMTSTKPGYNRVSYFEEGNDADTKWNINVILLLNQYNLIDIVGLDLDADNRYIFTIKIKDERILKQDSISQKLFDEIRERENKRTQDAFCLMDNAIKKQDHLCWSEMFYETYPLVAEYCAGCNAHENVEADELGRFPLLSHVGAISETITEEAAAFFAGTNEALIFTEERQVDLAQFKPNVVVCDEEGKVVGTDAPVCFYMNFAEFRDLQIRNDDFYLSGVIMALYSEQDEIARKQYKIMSRAVRQKKYVIHVAAHDLLISASGGKHLSDSVSGTIIR